MSTLAQISSLVQLRACDDKLVKWKGWGQLREGMDGLAAKGVGPRGVEFDDVGNIVKLDIGYSNVTGAKPALCSTRATPDVTFTALPPSIGECKSLTSLNLQFCRSLAGESNPLYVAPMLHLTSFSHSHPG